MKKLTYAATLLFSFLPSLVLAEMPNYDVDAHCKKISDFSGGSETLKQSCYEMEQEAYNSLKPDWDVLSQKIRTHCEQVSKFGGSASYSLLRSCVEQESDAADKNKNFKFQR